MFGARDIRITVITPSRGDRPRALAQAGRSLESAAGRAVLEGLMAPGQVQWLVGFDGVKGARPKVSVPSRFIDFPKSGNFGNFIRDRLIRLAAGSHLMFLDDDNALTENALTSLLPHLASELVIARIDVSLAFDIPFLPRPASGRETGGGEFPAQPPADTACVAREAVQPGNIDPLCLCVSRELVTGRGRGWSGEGGYESDFINIRRYFLRARSVAVIEDVVGVYDAGRGLDPEGMNARQSRAAPAGSRPGPA
jgi:hypothetical protein